VSWYTAVLKNYAGFTGRARRAEYWWFALINIIIVIVLYAIGIGIRFPFLGLIYSLAVLVPGLAVAVRRLHDTDKSGWWVLISLIPFVGGIILIVLLALEGTQGPNKYGPSPKFADAAGPGVMYGS
jgi:uncharacterized membrane protein YhaH (DUF805 family)